MTLAEEDLWTFIQAYSLKGINDWAKVASDATRGRAEKCLRLAIADEDDIYHRVLPSLRNHSASQLYVPMPSHSSSIDWTFFRPTSTYSQSGVKLTLDLFLLVGEDETKGIDDPLRNRCLAFRWEHAEHPTKSHGYAHVQMSRSTMKKEWQHAEIPSWLPVSYPAIPINVADALDMFLLMAVSIHGYPMKIREIVRDIFPSAPLDARAHLEKVSRRLLPESMI